MNTRIILLLCFVCLTLTISSSVRAQVVDALPDNQGVVLGSGVLSISSLLSGGLDEIVNVFGTVLQSISEDVIYGLFGSLIRIVFGLIQTLVTGSIAQTFELLVGILSFVQYEVPFLILDVVAQVTQPLLG